MKRVMMKMRETRPVRAVPQIRLMKVLPNGNPVFTTQSFFTNILLQFIGVLLRLLQKQGVQRRPRPAPPQTATTSPSTS